MNEQSVALSNISRGVAAVSSVDAEIEVLEQELGVKDAKGNYQTEWAEEERGQAKAATSEKLAKIAEMGKQQPAAPTPDGTTPKKDKDVLGMNKESVMSQVAGGVTDAVQSMVNLGIDAADYIDNKIGSGKVIPDDYKATFADDWFPESELAGNKVIRGVSQFVIPYAGLSKVSKAAGLVKSAAPIAGMATDFLAFEGDEERLSNLVQSNPDWANPITEFLVAKPTDSEAEKRLKNVIEGAGLGVLTEGVFKTLKYIKAKKSAKEGLKIADELERGAISPESVAKTKSAADIPSTLVDDPAINVKAPQKVVDPVDLTKEVSLDEKGGVKLNLSKMKTTDDVKTVMRNFEEANSEAIEKFRGGSTPDAELENLAREAGVTKEQLLSKRSGEALNTNELTAARMFLNSSAEKLAAAVKTASTDKSPESYNNFLEAMHEMELMHYVVTGSKTEKGRSLHSLSVAVGAGEGMADAMATKIALMGGEKNVEQMVTMLSSIPQDQLAKVARKSKFATAFDATFEVFVNNLLSNPKTHAVNFASNFSVAVNSTIERALAPFAAAGKVIDAGKVKAAVARQAELMKIDKASLKFDDLLKHEKELQEVNNVAKQALSAGVERGEFLEASKAQTLELANQTLAAFNGFKDGIKSLLKSAMQFDGKGLADLAKSETVDPFTKLEGLEPAITAEKFGMSGSSGNAIDIIGGIQRLPSKGLAWADNFWKAVNYRGEVHALAYRLGKKQGLTGEEFSTFVDGFVKDPPDYIQASAIQKAQKNTFTNPLDTDFGKNIDKLIKSEIVGVQPLKFVIPFSRTPLNIAKYALDRTPLAVLSNEYKAAIAKGGADAQMVRSQMALGTAIMGTATLMAGAGYMTGGGPKDTKMRKLLEDQGWKPYSVRVGDRYIPMNKFEPIGSLVALAGDLSDIAGAVGDDIPVTDAQQLGGLIAWAAVKRLTPEMMMDSFGRLFQAIEDGDLSGFIADRAAKSVPLAGMANVARQGEDPSARDTRADPNDPFPFLQEVMNKVKNQIPGFSTDLPPRKNIWGDDVTHPQGFGANLVSPFIGSKFDAKDPVLSELVRLGYAGPLSKVEPPDGEQHLAVNMPPRELSLGGGQVDLTPQQYARFVELSAGKGLERGPFGKASLKETLKDLIKGNYAEIGSEKLKTDQNKRTMIKKYIQSYRNAAKIQMLEEFPEIEEKLNNSVDAIKRARGG